MFHRQSASAAESQISGPRGYAALKGGKLLTRGTPDRIMQGDVLKGICGVDMCAFAHPVTDQPTGYVQ